ncbi:grasp-with-spasm system SPASM domain peptide maturase [Chryseobacterium sp. MEBOG06]|uniref:grasp-with-spasm system SPASM domain peptide maturase n=1 Tax=Chryseobacterium sp. MEBOG06 TaxID=2879938 RepID=UPI001EFF9642|nr:grasp-with-spasm system SPASM domain peptide maturase [Chryseobacterium sp. MEBOG06]UKB84878.1 grasp-with-spasm system SPASM domain peptide maturase [Chryseobacterium sp. MEBOG06]
MYLKLFSSCKIVVGKKFALILDTQRQMYYQIPDTMSEVIDMLNDFSISEIKDSLQSDSIEIFDSYIKFLIENEFAFYTNTPHQFIYNDFNKSYLNDVMNCILEISSFERLENYIGELKKLKIQAIHISLYTNVSLQQFSELINKIATETAIISISISFTSDLVFDVNKLSGLKHQYPILTKIFIHNSTLEKNENSDLVNYIKKTPLTSCGAINSCFFSCNAQFYQESHFVNSCLNNKISIDKDGNIKNCPSMSQSFGNIRDTTLEDALNHAEFKKYWNLTKDSIEVCKDCEFRYICTDCRAYTEQTDTNTEGLDVSKPLKCGYNPYTGEWEEWSKNPLKQKAIQHYGMQDLVKK